MRNLSSLARTIAIAVLFAALPLFASAEEWEETIQRNALEEEAYQNQVREQQEEQNAAYEREQNEMLEQQLANEREEAQQREMQLQEQYQLQTPAQSFISQFGNCPTCQ
jgi:heat shock protein HspQ